VRLSRVFAQEVGIEPAMIRGREDQGLIYFTWAETPVVGAQCGNCNFILWVNQRNNGILSGKRPAEIPESGPGYRVYAEGKIARFLASMPSCPNCGHHEFNRLINNVNYPRFSKGGELGENVSSADVIKVDGGTIEVTVLE
jgi:hypothetical protein